MLEELTHVVITAAQLNTFWSMLFALKEYALRQFFERFLVRFLLLLSEEKSAECFVEASFELFQFLRRYERVIGIGTGLLIVVAAVLE